jgi:hypothetical protein
MDTGKPRSRAVYWILLTISTAFIATGIGILLFSEIPRFDQFLWAAGLGLGAALLASDNSKVREPDAPQQVNLARLRLPA